MQKLPCVISEYTLQDHLLRLWYLLNEHSLPGEHLEFLSLRIPEWTCRGFPSVTNEQHFQDYLWSTTLLTHRALSLGDLNKDAEASPCQLWTSFTRTFLLSEHCLPGDLDEYAEASLCQWWMPFTSPSSYLAYHIDSSSSLSLWRPEQWMSRGFPSVTNLNFCLPGNINEHAEASLHQWWMPFTRPSSE